MQKLGVDQESYSFVPASFQSLQTKRLAVGPRALTTWSLVMPPFSATTKMAWVLGFLPSLISTVLTPAIFLSDELTLLLQPAQVTPVKVA